MNPYSSDALLDQKRLDEIMTDPVQKERYETAEDFLRDNARPEDVQGILNGIDFRHPVEVVTVKEGEILQRSGDMERKNDLHPGAFLTDPGAKEKDLGLVDFGTDRASGKEKDMFQATRDFQALKSTASDFGRPTDNGFNDAGLLYKGGETQYFVPWKERNGHSVTDPQTQETKRFEPALERVISPAHKADKPDPPQAPETPEKSPMFQNKEEEQRQREAMQSNTQASSSGMGGQDNNGQKNQDLKEASFGSQSKAEMQNSPEWKQAQKEQNQQGPKPADNSGQNEEPNKNWSDDLRMSDSRRQDFQKERMDQAGAMHEASLSQQASKPDVQPKQEVAQQKSITPTAADIQRAEQSQRQEQQRVQEQQKQQEQTQSH